MSLGFSQAQSSLCPPGRWGGAWRRSPEEIGLCFRAVGVFTLTEGTAGAWGPWDAFSSWLCLSWCICMCGGDGYSCLGLRLLWGLVGYSCTSELVPLFPRCMFMWWQRCQGGGAGAGAWSRLGVVCRSSPGRLARALGRFQSAASALGQGAGKCMHALFQSTSQVLAALWEAPLCFQSS